VIVRPAGSVTPHAEIVSSGQNPPLSLITISARLANAPAATGGTSLIVLVSVIERLLPVESDTVTGILTLPNAVNVAPVEISSVRDAPDHETVILMPVGREPSENEVTLSSKVSV